MKFLMKIFLYSLLIIPGYLKSYVLQGYTYYDLDNWLNDPKNKHVIEKTIDHIPVKVKYLPAEFLIAKQEINEKKYSENVRDSMFSFYRNYAVFMLTYKKGSVDKEHARKGYIRDCHNMEKGVNLTCTHFASIQLETEVVHPSQIIYETNHGSFNEDSIYFIFDKSLFKKEDRLDFVFNDATTGNSDNHFIFFQKDLRHRPALL